MSRWIQGVIWVTGSCILSCPLCVCISGGGSWWVCACTVGLISVTMVSGYATWTVISQLLNGTSLNNHFLSRFLTFQNEDNNEDKKDISSLIDSSFLEREISITAQTFHSHLVLPWYSYISPDDKYSLQIRSTLEDLLTGVFKNLRQHTKLSILFQEILTLYLQHYRQFYRALKKVSQKLKKRPVDCVTQEEEIINVYKPIHTALKTEKGIHLHCRRLAHLLLINYLPSEVTRCNLLFICIRDLFAQNLLHSVLDVFCDRRWLNEALISALAQTMETAAKKEPSSVAEDDDKPEKQKQDLVQEVKEERVYSYTHSLSAIREETSMEVLGLEASWGEISVAHSLKFNVSLAERRGSENFRKEKVTSERVHDRGGEGALSERKIENTQALLKYVQSSNFDKESREESKRSVAMALGDLISTTTGPLLPDAISFPHMPTKMWKSPLEEERDVISEIKPMLKKNPFRRIIVEGLTETDYKELHEKLKKETAKDDAVMKVTRSSGKVLLSPGSTRRKGETHFLSLPELQRSKSLNSLPSRTGKDTEGGLSSSKLSSSSEGISRAWSSLDDSGGDRKKGSAGGSRKAKGQLQKMNSFDKNDGTDEFSLTCVGVFPEGGGSGDSTTPQYFLAEGKPRTLLDKKESPKTISVSPPSTSSSSTSTLAGGDPADKPSPNSLDLPLSPLVESAGGFGWENPDLSPIYEESENLASTIAKLRCLLSERQSQHSLGSQSSFGSSESEPKSAHSDPGKYNLEKSRFTFLHKDSSGSLASVKSSSSTDSSSQCHGLAEEEPLEAAEVPIDGKVFVSIAIPTTEVHSEVAGFQYTMYLIQYDAIYLCEVLPPTTGEGAGVGDITQVPDHKMMLQTNVVKRRFREFLSLHSALEDEPTLRMAMKGIKGPNKWLNLPFSKLDSATISSRKQFLEKYLQALIQRPAINTCAALKDFLAYGSDSSIAFVKKPLEINVPRLDKLLARTVSGVFHSIKTALPNFDTTETPLQGHLVPGTLPTIVPLGLRASILSIPEGSSVKGTFSFDKERHLGSFGGGYSDYDVHLDITAEEQVCEMEGTLLTAITSTSELNSPIETASEAHDFKCPETHKLPSLPTRPISFLPKTTQQILPTLNPIFQGVLETPSNNLPSSHTYHTNPLTSFWTEIGLSAPPATPPLRRQESQDSFGVGDNDFETIHPLFSALMDAVVEIVASTDHPLTRQGSTILISRLWAHPITNFIQSKLDCLVSEELLGIFFDRIRFCIANSGAGNPRNSSEIPSDAQQNSKERLKTTLGKLIPSVFELALGTETTRESLTLFVESLQHPTLNRDLGLHLIDLIFVHLLLPV